MVVASIVPSVYVVDNWKGFVVVKAHWFFLRWLRSWIELAVGLVSVLSLGIYRPWWDFSYMVWFSKWQLKNKEPRHL